MRRAPDVDRFGEHQVVARHRSDMFQPLVSVSPHPLSWCPFGSIWLVPEKSTAVSPRINSPRPNIFYWKIRIRDSGSATMFNKNLFAKNLGNIESAFPP